MKRINITENTWNHRWHNELPFPPSQEAVWTKDVDTVASWPNFLGLMGYKISLPTVLCFTCWSYAIMQCYICFLTFLCIEQQGCFWSGRVSKQHKIGHPTQEYCLVVSFKHYAKGYCPEIYTAASRQIMVITNLLDIFACSNHGHHKPVGNFCMLGFVTSSYVDSMRILCNLQHYNNFQVQSISFIPLLNMLLRAGKRCQLLTHQKNMKVVLSWIY